MLDRVNRIAYACISPRTDLDVLGDFAQQLDYEIVAFEAFDAAGAPIYHTNVLMCVGARFAAVCSECIRAGRARRGARRVALERSRDRRPEHGADRRPSPATCSNCVRRRRRTVVAMSTRARDSLTAAAAAGARSTRRADRQQRRSRRSRRSAAAACAACWRRCICRGSEVEST